MSSIKKLMCNPPAEYVARNGDPRVAGMFAGAGAGVHLIDDDNVRHEFVTNVVMIEQDYMDKRRALEEETYNRMKEQFDWVLAKTDNSQSTEEENRE